jgi:hypothetical protein
VLEETKTHEDEDNPGLVPIIEPLRLMLDQIRPQAGSGWMFGNTIGGALDLDNLADRVMPVLKTNGLMMGDNRSSPARVASFKTVTGKNSLS